MQLLEGICPFYHIVCGMLCLKYPEHLVTLYIKALSMVWAAKGPLSIGLAYIGHV